MNMPIADINRSHIQTHTFAAETFKLAVGALKEADSNMGYSELKATEMLDQHFPLENGSHKDVTQYLVYFCHIMAFFSDGSHCGLAKPKQFVAFLGQKDKPESILLKEDGVHVEVTTNTCTHLNENESHIQVCFPTETSFTSKTGEDYLLN